MTRRPRRYDRGLLLFLPASLLLATAALMWAVTGEISGLLASELALERAHIDHVELLERAAGFAHVAAIERWLSDNTRRELRDQQAVDNIHTLRAAIDDFGKLTPLDADERAAGERLVGAATLLSNQLMQALFTSDVVGTTSDLEMSVATVRLQAGAVTTTVQRAGSSSDQRLARLRRQQIALEIAFVVIAMTILWIAISMSRRQLLASEETLRVQTQAAAQQAQFFANVSHELRTPLVAFRGFATMIVSSPEAGGESHDHARQIEGQAQELLGVINNILDASKLEAGAMQLSIEDVDVAEVVERCMQRCRSLAAGKPLELANQVRGPLSLRGDFVKLQQVLTNLIANAIKFTERGQVSVSARRDGDDVVEITVEDTGIGIEPDALPRLFQPFVQATGTTDRKYGGTGLGLSIVRGLVERMDGEVRVESTPGMGSTFRVRLPATGRGQ